MIYELQVNNPDTACVPWWPDVKQLKGRKKIKFTSGLNVLVGPNGSGKSTILSLMGMLFHCEQGGVQKPTWSSMNKVLGDRSRHLIGVKPIHDGKPVIYTSPDKKVGTFGGSFDEDFFMEGVRNTMFRGSSGETTIQRLGLALAVILGHEKAPPIDMSRVTRMSKEVEAFLAGNKKLKKGQRSRPTIILDEPDRSLDMNWQIGFWVRAAQAARSRAQILVAAHSPMVFFVPKVNIIELEPGYADAVKDGIHKLLDESKFKKLIKESKPIKKPKKS